MNVAPLVLLFRAANAAAVFLDDAVGRLKPSPVPLPISLVVKKRMKSLFKFSRAMPVRCPRKEFARDPPNAPVTMASFPVGRWASWPAGRC